MSVCPVPDAVGGTEDTERDPERALLSVSQLHLLSVDSKADSQKSGLTRPLLALVPLLTCLTYSGSFRYHRCADGLQSLSPTRLVVSQV